MAVSTEGLPQSKTLVRPLAVRISSDIVNDSRINSKHLRNGTTESKKLFALLNNLIATNPEEDTPDLFRAMSAQGRLIDPRRYTAGFYDDKLDEIEAAIAPELRKAEFTVQDIGAFALSSEQFRLTFQLTDASEKELDKILEPLHELPVSFPTPPLSPNPYHNFVLDIPAARLKPQQSRKRQNAKADGVDKLKKHGPGNVIHPALGISVAPGFDYRSRKNRLTRK